MRDIAEPQSHTVMENLPTCANCHSFSRDGKTLGLDMDGPRNDKGLYALVPVTKNITIANKESFAGAPSRSTPKRDAMPPAVKRFGFMSQVSPDGRYVVTSHRRRPTIRTHAPERSPRLCPGLFDRLYNTNFNDIQFSQVFFPTRGILAWYDREKKEMRPLPGADDPRYVQTSAFWSPDGKYLIFSRAASPRSISARSSEGSSCQRPE